MLTITPRVVEDILIFGLSGRVDGTAKTKEILESVRTALEEGRTKMILDLREVDWMNSLGVGYVVAAFVSVRNRGGRLKLIGGPGRVVTVLRKSGLIPNIIEVFTDEDSAVASFS